MGPVELEASHQPQHDAVVAGCPRHLLHQRLPLVLLHAGQVYTSHTRGGSLSGRSELLHRAARPRTVGPRVPRGPSQHDQGVHQAQVGRREDDHGVTRHARRHPHLARRHGRHPTQRASVHPQDGEEGDVQLWQPHRTVAAPRETEALQVQ